MVLALLHILFHLKSPDGDPSNYLTYFKRAAVYLAIGQARKAIPDLDKTVELKTDFHQVADSFDYHFICTNSYSRQALLGAWRLLFALLLFVKHTMNFELLKYSF